MKHSPYLGRVQRTLIVTIGELATQSGALFETLMAQRQGPVGGTAVVPLLESEPDGLSRVIAAALTRISPPDLGARLAQTGWQLDETSSVRLLLLIAVEPETGDTILEYVQLIAGQVYQHLGIDPFVLPVWLVGEASDACPFSRLQEAVPLPLGSFVLSLCNQDGLRLPDEASLQAVAAELLWCLLTTPLLSLLEQRQVHVSNLEGAPLLAAGIHVWTWNTNQALARFEQRWLLDVLRQWVATNVDESGQVNAFAWLQDQQLTPKQFATYALREREVALPQLPHAAWRMPWPWHIPILAETTRFEISIDEEATRAYAKQAQLRLFDPLHKGREALYEAARRQLNTQPVAGVAHTVAWVTDVLTACEQQLTTAVDHQDALKETADALATARGELEGSLHTYLEDYPRTAGQWWTYVFRPWRWPRLLLRYWQLQQRGQQLCQLLEKQARLRRQIIQEHTAYQGLIELMQMARHLGDQIAEIGQMLEYLIRSQTDLQDVEEAAPESLFLVTTLPVPDSIYARLVPDPAAAATEAAAAIGGLGTQIRQLDDAILEPLRAYGRSQLAGLMQLKTAELLQILLADNSSDSSPLERGWEAAAPLWRVDAASLAEEQRLNQQTFTVLCGAEALLLSDKLPDAAESIFTLPTGWTRHLWLIRLHIGQVQKDSAVDEVMETVQPYESL